MDKEELKNEIHRGAFTMGLIDDEGDKVKVISVKVAKYLIDQLDEPEEETPMVKISKAVSRVGAMIKESEDRKEADKELGKLGYKVVPIDEPELTEEQAWEMIGNKYAESADEAKDIFQKNYREKTLDEVEKESKIADKYKEVVEKLIAEIERLREDEPEKPVVPAFVSEWIEHLKNNGMNLLAHIYDFTHDDDLNDYIHNNGDILMRAWLDGFSVEEKKYYGWFNRMEDGKKVFAKKQGKNGFAAFEFDAFEFESVEELEEEVVLFARPHYQFTEKDKERLFGRWSHWLTWEEVTE